MIFAYVIALSPNTMFKVDFFIPIVFISISFVTGLIFFFSFIFFPMYINTIIEVVTIINYKESGLEIVRPFAVSILIALALVLLVNLIVVVKICYFQRASLRPFMKPYASSYSKNSPCVKNS